MLKLLGDGLVPTSGTLEFAGCGSIGVLLCAVTYKKKNQTAMAGLVGAELEASVQGSSNNDDVVGEITVLQGTE